MKKSIAVIIIVISLISIVSISSMSEQFADAGSRKKIHFTQTITSSQDPGQGHENYQMIFVLSPNDGTLYDGSMTFTSSEPIQVVVLHEIDSVDSKGQTTWTVDGKTIYGLSIFDTIHQSGSYKFAI